MTNRLLSLHALPLLQHLRVITRGTRVAARRVGLREIVFCARRWRVLDAEKRLPVQCVLVPVRILRVSHGNIVTHRMIDVIYDHRRRRHMTVENVKNLHKDLTTITLRRVALVLVLGMGIDM